MIPTHVPYKAYKAHKEYYKDSYETLIRLICVAAVDCFGSISYAPKGPYCKVRHAKSESDI